MLKLSAVLTKEIDTFGLECLVWNSERMGRGKLSEGLGVGKKNVEYLKKRQFVTCSK